MLVPVRQLYPIRLASPAETRTFALETNLPVAPILQPKIFFKNTSTDPVRVQIYHILDLGVSDDPMLSGAYSTLMVDELVGPAELLWHVFPAMALMEGIVRHEVTVSTTGAVSDVILEMWIEGTFEESLKVLPTFDPITI